MLVEVGGKSQVTGPQRYSLATYFLRDDVFLTVRLRYLTHLAVKDSD